MKYSVAFLVGMVLVAAPSVATAENQNLVANPSFELADAEGVVADEWKTRAGIPVERFVGTGRTSNACVRFTNDNPRQGRMLASRRMPARPGAKYTAAAWLRKTQAFRQWVDANCYDFNGRRIEQL